MSDYGNVRQKLDDMNDQIETLLTENLLLERAKQQLHREHMDLKAKFEAHVKGTDQNAGAAGEMVAGTLTVRVS